MAFEIKNAVDRYGDEYFYLDQDGDQIGLVEVIGEFGHCVSEWSTFNNSCLDSNDLRQIADKLDELNKGKAG